MSVSATPYGAPRLRSRDTSALEPLREQATIGRLRSLVVPHATNSRFDAAARRLEVLGVNLNANERAAELHRSLARCARAHERVAHTGLCEQPDQPARHLYRLRPWLR